MNKDWTILLTFGGGFFVFIGALATLFILMDRLWKSLLVIGFGGLIAAVGMGISWYHEKKREKEKKEQ